MIISLTTIPPRINNIEKTLNSLINQTISAEKIILNLPQKYKKYKGCCQIPDFLQKMIDNKSVEINNCQEDYGPATKFYPLAIKYNKSSINRKIIAVDDDCIYDPNMVKSYILNDKYSSSALTLRGGPSSVKQKWYHLHTHPRNCSEPIEVDIITGVASFMINSSFINEDYLSFRKNKDKQIRKIGFMLDDDWLSGYLAKKGIKKLLIPHFEPQYKSKYGYYLVNKEQKETPQIKGGNKRRRNYILTHFKDYWKFINL